RPPASGPDSSLLMCRSADCRYLRSKSVSRHANSREKASVVQGGRHFAEIQLFRSGSHLAEKVVQPDRYRQSRFVERMLTVVATCRQQGRNVLDDLTSCFQAARKGYAIPSLLPVTEPAINVA